MDEPVNPESQRRAEWIRTVREKIEVGWQQSERGEMLDGEEVFRRLKKVLEERGDGKRTQNPLG